jgi:ferritin
VKLSLDWEVEVTNQIHKLVDLAKKEVNYTTDNFLQWFVKEQLEEVSSMDNLLKVIRRAGQDGLLRVEEYLARKPVGKSLAEKNLS